MNVIETDWLKIKDLEKIKNKQTATNSFDSFLHKKPNHLIYLNQGLLFHKFDITRHSEFKKFLAYKTNLSIFDRNNLTSDYNLFLEYIENPDDF